MNECKEVKSVDRKEINVAIINDMINRLEAIKNDSKLKDASYTMFNDATITVCSLTSAFANDENFKMRNNWW